MSATAAIHYPQYAQGRNEEVVWFDKPLDLGTRRDVPGQELVALGISRGVAPRTVAALIIDVKDKPGRQPMLLGRLLKFDPAFDVAFDPATLAQLVKTHDLVAD